MFCNGAGLCKADEPLCGADHRRFALKRGDGHHQIGRTPGGCIGLPMGTAQMPLPLCRALEKQHTARVAPVCGGHIEYMHTVQNDPLLHHPLSGAVGMGVKHRQLKPALPLQRQKKRL